MHPRIVQLQESTSHLRQQLIQHPAYPAIKDLDGVRSFMEHHIYAVWDFMSLLKALQNELTCTQVPWMPTGNPEVRYLINEIVTGEESDVDQNGQRKSHFELYLEAMQQCQASTYEINHFLDCIRGGATVEEALLSIDIPESIRSFVRFTFEVIATRKPHIIAAVFTFGREDLIPNMFRSIVDDINRNFPDQVSIFKYYLDRHIEVDGDHHSHLAIQMVTELCGYDDLKWQEASHYVQRALESRVELWNGVAREITVTI